MYEKTLLERAIEYAMEKHHGQVRKIKNTPYILHPMEVAQIISTMTSDEEVIAAGILHDILEDTDGTKEELTELFGERVVEIVESESEARKKGEGQRESWQRRKEASIKALAASEDLDVKRLWLADKLSNIRSMAESYREVGDAMWKNFHNDDPLKHRWYYKTIAENLELYLNRTAAYKEFVYQINYIWPGALESSKERYRKFREVSIDGCKKINQGAKGEVYRYDDELIIKVYNKNNTFNEIERENVLTRKAFIAGIPTVISFGIVTVGDRYGAMFELMNSETVMELIREKPDRVNYYADVMADLAKQMHAIPTTDLGLSPYRDTVQSWLDGSSLGLTDPVLREKIQAIMDSIPESETILHGDFHAGNVFLLQNEPIVIDLDRLSYGNPIYELSAVHMAYVGFYEYDEEGAMAFNGYGKDVARAFYVEFMKHYLEGIEEAEAMRMQRTAELLDYVRLVRRLYKKTTELDENGQNTLKFLLLRINDLVSALSFGV